MENTTSLADWTGSYAGPDAVSTVGNATVGALFTHEPEQCMNFPPDDIFDLRDDEAKAETYIIKQSLKSIMLPVLYTVLVVGVLANCAFFYVVARVPYMRNNTNIFLTNLAIADITFIVTSVICYQIYLSGPVRSHYGTAKILGCLGSFGPQYITYYASLGIVTLVTVERYSSICRPLRHRSVNTRRRAVKLVVCSWLLCLGLTAVAMLRYTDLSLKCVLWPDSDGFRDLPVIIGYCLPVWPWGLLVANFTESIPFLAAFIANTFMYVGIIRRLSNRAVFTGAKGGDQSASLPAKAQQVRSQVSRMLIANGVVFFLCNTPSVGISIAFIVSFLRGYRILEIYETLSGMVVISHGMLFLNSAINPFIYNATSSHYRQAFVDAFSCADTSGRPRLDSSSVAVVPASKKLSFGERFSLASETKM